MTSLRLHCNGSSILMEKLNLIIGSRTSKGSNSPRKPFPAGNLRDRRTFQGRHEKGLKLNSVEC